MLNKRHVSIVGITFRPVDRHNDTARGDFYVFATIAYRANLGHTFQDGIDAAEHAIERQIGVDVYPSLVSIEWGAHESEQKDTEGTIHILQYVNRITVSDD